MKKTSVFLSLFLFAMFTLKAQTQYRATANEFTVAGTSTLHDWTMTSKTATITVSFEVDPAGKPMEFSNLTVTMAPTSLKSGKGPMDENAYKSLKTKQHNVIKYAAVNGSVKSAGGNKFTMQTNGMLTVAGKTISAPLTATCTLNADGSLSCEGSRAMKMTQVGVEPPTFMFGSIKTGDDITISFKTTLKK